MMPSLWQIQRTSLALIALAGILLLVAGAPAAGLGCVIGGGVMVANLFILILLGRFLSSAAAGGTGPTLGAVAIPLKMLLIAGLVYMVLARTGIDAVGFAIGVSTQLVAIVLETFRASRPAGGEGG